MSGEREELQAAVERLWTELARSESIAASVGAKPSRTMVNDADLRLILSRLQGASGVEGADGWRPTHRHVGRGTTYQVVLSDAELQASGSIEEGAILVIYKGQDGKLWARRAMEFYDGRFEPIAQEAPAK